MEEESLHWADQMAREVNERAEKDPILQNVVKKNGYIVYDEKTPSGKIHIGSGRGWIIHDAVAKSLRNLNLKGRFILSSDDIDPFDKMNKELPKSFEKYLGMPFRDIPSPVKGYKSFAEHYFMQCVEKFEEFGIDAEIESTGKRYDDGDFNTTIKIALDNADRINAIYERLYGKAPDKLPFNPVCEKCGRIGTTQAYEWDSEKEILKYRCKKDLVKWAEGCGHEGELSPYDGNGKFPWKIEWAAKWPTVGAVCELAGKDHFTQGGARTMAVAVSDEIFDYPPPYPSTRKSTGKGYEFFTVGGRKMSTSKGEGMGFAEATEYVPAPILRYLLVATRPNAVIDFDPVNRNDLILLYERFDKSERVYFGKEEITNEHDIQKHKRIYELAHVGKLPKSMPPQISLGFAAVLIQSTLTVEKAIQRLKEMDYIPDKLSKEDVVYINERLHFAEKWVREYAPEQYKFQLQEKVSAEVKKSLDEKQKEALKALIKTLGAKKWDEKELHNEFYSLSEKTGLDPKEFFRAAYLVLIGKERGPKLANFILTLGKEKAIKVLEQI